MTANYMLPRSAARSAIRHEQKRQVRAAMRGMRSDTAPGEKIMGALMPGRGYAFPGGWSQDRIAQIQHMKDWTGVCIDKIASLCAQLVPNVAYVSQGRPKSASKGYSPYRQQLDGLTSGIRRLQQYDCAGYNFQTHPYRAKALGVVQPGEELEPVEWNHPLRRLIEKPNDWDTQYDHDYELVMFQYLCGVAYDWAVPVDYHWEDHKDFSTPVADGPFKDYPGELWCLPSHWVWPRSSGGSLVSPGHPDADKLIEYYEVRPWGGLGTAGVIRIPPDQIIRYAFKSPINKIDGWARTQMGAAWIDTDDSIATCQRSMMTNGIYPSFWLEMGEGFSDLTDDQVDRVEAKIYQKLGGENRFGRPFISSQGTKPHPLVFPPNQYAFADSGDQSRNRIVALFGLNLSILGMSETRTFGSVLADLMSVIVNSIKQVLTANGQTKTKCLARYFSTPQRPLKCWYDDPTPIDPDQLNKDLAQDLACILPGQKLQGQVIGGSKAWYSGQAVEITSRSGAVILVTPNHPVMTMEGFVPAGQLEKGQCLLRHQVHGSVPAENDVQNAPAIVDDVFDALASAFQETRGEMTCSSVDFHGDAKGFDGKIQIVGSYGQLRRSNVAESFEDVSKLSFVGLSLEEASLGSNRHLGTLNGSVFSSVKSSRHIGDMAGRQFSSSKSGTDFLSSESSSRFDGQGFPPFLSDRFVGLPIGFSGSAVGFDSSPDIGLAHGDSGGLRCAPNGNASAAKVSPEPLVADAVLLSQILDRNATGVQSSKLSHVGSGLGVQKPLCFGPSSDLDASLAECRLESVDAADALLAAKLSNRFPSEVATDEIIKIREFHYEGLVYDFESPFGFIVIESILVSNCAAITPNEVRALRGRPAYEHGGDDPMVPGPGGLIPFPMNTGYDLSGLAELVPLMGRQENPAAEEEEAESGLGSPQVEEPNGKPGKPKKTFDGNARRHDDDTGQFAPMSGVPEEEENLSTTLANGKTVEFTAKDSDGEATIMVDTAFLDGAWEGDEDYIEPGEDPDGKAEAFRRFLAKGKPVKAARATMDNGVVSFTDGGYRFSVLRDEGAEQMAVTVPKDQVDLFKPRAQQKRLSGRFQLKDGRWITINSEDGDGTHVFIDGSGTVTAGPPKLEGRKLDGPKSSLPNADKPSRKASTVKLEKGNEDKITRIWKEMLGDVPIDNVASLMGVPDGAELELDVWEESEGKLIDVKIYGEGYDANRFIRTNDNGEVFIYNAEFKVKDTGKGLGAQIFAKQVESASKIGVKYIECFAEGKANSRFNGYYTWPRFGYDATIADSFNHETQQKIEEAFPEAKTVQDIFKTKEGREWWKKNGSGTEMKFDLTKGSRSRKVLKAYQEEVKTRSKKSTSPPSKKLHSTGPGKASKSSYGPRSALPKFSKNGVH